MADIYIGLDAGKGFESVQYDTSTTGAGVEVRINVDGDWHRDRSLVHDTIQKILQSFATTTWPK